MEHSKVILELEWLEKRLLAAEMAMLISPAAAMKLLMEAREAVSMYNAGRAKQREIVEEVPEKLMDAVTIINVKVVREGNTMGVIHDVPAGMYTMREVGRAFGLMHFNSAEYAKMLIDRLRDVHPEDSKSFSAGYIEGAMAGGGPCEEGGSDGFSMIR